MKNLVSAWPEAIKQLFKDPVNFPLFLIPAVISVTLYAFAAKWVAKSGWEFAETMINRYALSKESGFIVYTLLSTVLAFFFFVLVSWTFILVMGMIASPFNDAISARIERKMRGEAVSRKMTLSGIGHTLFNEIKKIIVILLLTVMATMLNFFPVLFPLAAAILALLIAAQFLDYSWSRHNLPWNQCFSDLMKHPFEHILSGGIFLLLVTVPLINVLVPALATSYYTVLWTRRQKSLAPPLS